MGKFKWAGLVVLLVVFVWVAWNTLLAPSSPAAVKSQAAEAKTYSDVEVYSQAETILMNYLKSPSTAKFPTTSHVKIQRFTDGYRVDSYVDAENSFGAMLRSDWTVIFQYVGEGAETYAVVLDGQTLYKKATQ